MSNSMLVRSAAEKKRKKLLKKHKPSKLNQDETDHLNGPIIMEEIELII